MMEYSVCMLLFRGSGIYRRWGTYFEYRCYRCVLVREEIRRARGPKVDSWNMMEGQRACQKNSMINIVI